jgi:uncharacterized protein YjiS (DUF1127 family)
MLSEEQLAVWERLAAEAKALTPKEKGAILKDPAAANAYGRAHAALATAAREALPELIEEVRTLRRRNATAVRDLLSLSERLKSGEFQPSVALMLRFTFGLVEQLVGASWRDQQKFREALDEALRQRP